MQKYPRSAELFDRGRKVIPDGVSSPMRAFAQVEGAPICVRSAQGARVIDADGNSYLDFLNGFGALILGHAWPSVVAAIQQQAAQGTVYGLSTELEYERNLAELTRSHTKEFFELQQIVFARNGEIIDLKNKLLKFNLNGPI